MHYVKKNREKIRTQDYFLDVDLVELIEFLGRYHSQKPSRIVSRCILYQRRLQNGESNKESWEKSSRCYKKKKKIHHVKNKREMAKKTERQKEIKQLSFF